MNEALTWKCIMSGIICVFNRYNLELLKINTSGHEKLENKREGLYR